jgi:ubiquinol-cytochrome c reductase cytochrome b subunit
LIVGGPNYGHHTLTRFFAMHAGVLPALLVLFLVMHIYVFRRHGITAKEPMTKPATTFWPDQVLKDAVACLAVLLIVLLLVLRHAPHDPAVLSQLAGEGRLGEVMGADLGAPADPAESYAAARPEWYFLFLFQFLKFFPGESEIYGAVVIPGLLMFALFLMPFVGRWKLGHAFNVTYLATLLVCVGGLTYLAIDEDGKDPKYQRAVAGAEKQAQRVIDLVQSPNRIGSSGARALLRSDPKTYGPSLFARNCSACHRFDGHDGTGKTLTETATASDLGKFGAREWIRGFITEPAGEKYFGPTIHGSFEGEPIGDRFVDGEMADWAADNVPEMQQREVDGVVEFLLAQSKRSDISQPDPELVEIGRRFFSDGSENAAGCSDCHAMEVDGEVLGDLDAAAEGGYPRLTGYASEEWLRDFLLNPGADRHYGERNAMPSYTGRMNDDELEILLRWMRRRWYEPGQPVEEE